MAPDRGYRLDHPIPADCRAAAAGLFWQAFAAKLTRVMGPEQRALRFIASVLDPGHGIAALDRNARLIGLAGYKTDTGGLVGGQYRDLRRVYGLFGALWRGLLLSQLERPLAPDTLLMDGIAVVPDARGTGVGTALLAAIKDRARTLGKSYVRLDVIDSNPRARALYEREGFVAGPTSDLGPLAPIFGFKRSTTMTFAVTEPPRPNDGAQPPGHTRPSHRETKT